jgi:hypothetical protein
VTFLASDVVPNLGLSNLGLQPTAAGVIMRPSRLKPDVSQRNWSERT